MQLPKDFEAYTRDLMGEALYASLRRGLDEEAPTSIRLNPFKCAGTQQQEHGYGVYGTEEEVRWCAQGIYLDHRPNFTFDPLFHAGRYYVQEAASMFVTHILRQLVHHPVLMLDLCAAPGGKSTAARSVLPTGSVLVSNEPMKLRASILSENIQKFGHPDSIVTNNFPEDFNKSDLMFDVILADVPCSGEGMFRKDEGAIAEWSTQNVAGCTTLQRQIIADIWPNLRDGGLLIYSTCTFNAHENEENVYWIAESLGADYVEVAISPEWDITGSLTDDHPVYRFFPGKTKSEGLFVAVLRKHGDSRSEWQQTNGKPRKPSRKQKKEDNSKQGAQAIETLRKQWLDGDWTTVEHRERWLAIPREWLHVYQKAANALHVIHAGVALGMVKGRDMIPDEALALSVALSPKAFPRVDVDYTTAISYLRKEAVVLPADAPRGFVLISYRQQPLGFVKNIGNRANNLYPQEWKIKSSYAPQQPVEVMGYNRPTTDQHED